MKVQILPLIATCLAGADAAALGSRASFFNWGSIFPSLGNNNNAPLNVQALQDGLSAVTKKLNEAANPTKPGGFFGIFPPQVPASLSAIVSRNRSLPRLAEVAS